MEKIKDFFESVGSTVNGWFNLSIDALYVGIACLALALIILVVAIIIIVVCAKKSKKKKALKTEKPADQNANAEPVKETETAEETVSAPVAEKVDEAPVEEVKEETVKEEVVTASENIEEEKEEAPVAEKPTKKPAAKKGVTQKGKAQEKTPAKPAKKLNGKWVVEIKSAGEYDAKLLASNGEVMLTSEIYTTEDGARNGIATIIKGVETGNFVIYQDKNKNYYYKLKTAGNRLLCVGEIYKSKDQCVKAAETVKRIAAGSTILSELVEGARYIEYTPAEIDTKKTLRGKWKIETVDDGKFSARLYASNGQLMLATEEVANRKTAENAIESVKKNALEGNFIIDRDKFGRFYYKLRNVQRSVICIGEAYESLDSCVSAIESVRRFATTSQLVTDSVQ
jgi:uncharacterized protein YegP (UPF0339 family)